MGFEVTDRQRPRPDRAKIEMDRLRTELRQVSTKELRATVATLVGDAGVELVTLTGPDANDFWKIVEINGGDSLVTQQWDDSGAAFLERLEIIGKGTGVTDEGDIIWGDNDGNETRRWDNSAGQWIDQFDSITEATQWAVDFRTRGLGVDSGDQWVLRSAGDDFTMSQWDDSASVFLDRFQIRGKGTSVTDEGDIIFYDLDGVEVIRYDESDGRWKYANPPSGIADYEEWFEDGTLVTTTGSVRWYPPFDITITDVSIFVGAVPTGASIIVDVNKGGTTIFTTQSNRPEIAVSAFHDVSGVPAITGVNKDSEYLTVDIDQIGSTIAGADLVIQVRFVAA